MDPKRYEVELIRVKEIAEGTCEVSCTRPQQFNFIAGQYLQIRLPKLLYPDPKGDSRVFSIASPPEDTKKITIAFRQSGSGFKKTLTNLPVNTKVILEGPFGDFTLPQKATRPIFFIAGGIGITPCISIIRHAHATKRPHQITLLYANRSPQTAAYLEELQRIAQENEKITLYEVYGPVEEKHLMAMIQNNQNPLWYIVGPPAMVYAVRDLLLRSSVSDQDILFEEFEGY